MYSFIGTYEHEVPISNLNPEVIFPPKKITLES